MYYIEGKIEIYFAFKTMINYLLFQKFKLLKNRIFNYLIITLTPILALVETWEHEIPSITLKMVGFPWVFDPHPIIKSMGVNFLQKKKKEKTKKSIKRRRESLWMLKRG